jgi:hypothetical protein
MKAPTTKLRKRGSESIPSPRPARNAFFVSYKMTQMIMRLNAEIPNRDIPEFTTVNLKLLFNFEACWSILSAKYCHLK